MGGCNLCVRIRFAAGFQEVTKTLLKISQFFFGNQGPALPAILPIGETRPSDYGNNFLLVFAQEPASRAVEDFGETPKIFAFSHVEALPPVRYGGGSYAKEAGDLVVLKVRFSESGFEALGEDS